MSKQDSLLPRDWMFRQTGTKTIAPDDVYSMQTTAPVSIATDVERNSESYSTHLIDLDSHYPTSYDQLYLKNAI